MKMEDERNKNKNKKEKKAITTARNSCWCRYWLWSDFTASYYDVLHHEVLVG